MRVAIFTDNDFAKVNGVTTTLSAVLRHAPADLHPRIYTAADEDVDHPTYFAMRSLGVPIPFYGEMRMYLPRVGAYLERARADRIDVIHLTTPGPMGLAAMRVARRLRIPMVGSFHTDLAAYARHLSGSAVLSTVMREFMRWPYGRCQRILVPSESTRGLLARPGSTQRLDIWPRGVDTDAFSPAHRSAQLRGHWRASADCPVILYVGRVSREKGLNLLPAIQMRLRMLGINHRFVIAGDGPMLPELRARMRHAVFTGTLSRPAVAAAFASADAFVFPSRTDTAGNVVLEAQASGLPILVADAGGPRENILPGRTGFVVAGTDPDNWVRVLGPLLRDEVQRHRMGAAARSYAEGRSWSEALAPLYRAYRDVADAATPGADSLSHFSQQRAS